VGRPNFLLQNSLRFFENCAVSAQTWGGGERDNAVQTYGGKGGWDQLFAILCGLFYRRPLAEFKWCHFRFYLYLYDLCVNLPNTFQTIQ